MGKVLGQIIEHDESILVFETRESIESLNKFVGKTSNWPWTNYKKKWKHVTSTLVPLRESEGKFRSRILITSFRTRLLDITNLYGGCKAVEDCIVDRGWIYNDSPKWNHFKARQERVKNTEDQFTRIRVEILD